MLNIGVLISGGGSNLQSIIDNISLGRIDGSIKVVISDRPGVYGLERAKVKNIRTCVFDRRSMTREDLNNNIFDELEKSGVQLVVLAGYLSILSSKIINKYKNAIINIHPSLIPSFCGNGYYGLRVHKAAIEYGVKVSGCTVHFVDEGCDTGPIILQKAVEISQDDTSESLQQKILKFEHELLPEAVRLICSGRIEVRGRKVNIVKEETL